MNKTFQSDVIHVKDIKLWAHVGVLDKERSFGQNFNLDFSIWLNLDEVSRIDKLSSTVDYSKPVSELKDLSFNIKCYTIEHYSEQILDRLEIIYGAKPMRIILKKCSPPIQGFSGSVSVERYRNFNFQTIV